MSKKLAKARNITGSRKRCYPWNLVPAVLLFSALFFNAPGACCKEGYVYDPRGRRDPFVPLIGQRGRGAESLEDIMSIEDVDLQGVGTDSSGKRVAIINGEMVEEKRTAGRLTIKKIMPEGVIIKIDEEEYTVKLAAD